MKFILFIALTFAEEDNRTPTQVEIRSWTHRPRIEPLQSGSNTWLAMVRGPCSTDDGPRR